MPVGREVEGGIVILTIRGEGADNRVTTETLLELDARFRELDADPSARVAILRGGERNFCAGSSAPHPPEDLHGIAARHHYPLTAPPGTPWALWPTLFSRRTVTPVVAAITGACFDAALVAVALNADVRIAGESARLGFPGLRDGTALGYACASRLVNQIPRPALNWLIETGEPYGARAAFDCHIVSEVVPDARVLARAREIAREIATVPAAAARTEKLTLIHLEGAGYEDAAPLAAALARAALQTRAERDRR
jgi:enoyl-CoA hydratase/carnithine racemase